MAIIQTPGTNFHDLNLDWLLNQMKNCLAEWESTKEDWEDLKQDNADFKAFVTNYFDNLDLSEEVSAKIDSMVEDGTLLELITHDEGDGSALSDVAGQWLSAHITQETGYVIDDSLTVEGAAADAKATGDAITDLKGAIDEMSPLIPYYGVKEYAGLLKANGTYGNTTQFHSLTTWKIKCAPGDKFIYKGLASGTAVSALFYNDATIVDTYATDARTNPAEVTIPSGCNGVVFSSYAGISSDIVFDLVGKSSLKYTTDAALEEAETRLQTQVNQLKKISVSIETGFTASHYIAYQTGNYTEHENTNYLASGYIDVSLYAGHTLSLLCTVAGSVTGLAFYKADRTYISGIGGGSVVPSQGTTPQAVSGTIPANAVYMRFTGYSTFSTNIKDYNVTVEISALGDALGALSHLVNGNGTEIDDIIKTDYVSLSMFEKIGVIGDSYASGEIYVGGSGADHYNLSWGQNIARMCGVTCTNYSRGGLTTKTWLSNTTYGLAKLLADDPLQLYMICLGLNDYGQIGQGTYSLGTIDDVKQDYTQNPDTFYGNYGRILGNIKTHAPNAKIIMCTVTEGQPNDFSTVNTAIVAIAEALELPLINLRDDSFFTSQFYRDTLVSNHPVAVGYSAYANGIMRLFAKCAIDNLNYFKDYVG